LLKHILNIQLHLRSLILTQNARKVGDKEEEKSEESIGGKKLEKEEKERKEKKVKKVRKEEDITESELMELGQKERDFIAKKV
jgi:hypothetical protein